MALDPELIVRKARLILEDLQKLEPVAALELDRYLADFKNELVAERLLERIVGRMVDINYHLALEVTGLPPSDYHASFLGLAQIGVIPYARAEQFARAAGLRNRLAHEYDRIDETKVHEAARTAVIEVPEYLRAVDAFVTARSEGS